MSDHFKQSIAELQRKLAEQEKEVTKTKELINLLAEHAGLPKMYAEVTEQSVPSLASLRADQFYGQPLHGAMRSYLTMRKHIGPASVADIYAALVKGGFQFETKNDENAKRIIRITLTKNSGVFHKLPNGQYGLLDWYPKAKPEKAGKLSAADVADDANKENEEEFGESESKNTGD